jgi:flagellar biosynthesis protein FlhG
MYDQASELRELVKDCVATGSRHASLAPLIVVGGGASGVGTTTIALNLAVALSRQGRRAVFVDADLDHGGKTSLSDMPSHGSTIDVLEGRCDIHEALLRGPCGTQILAGVWAVAKVCDYAAEAQQRFVAELKRLTPYVDAVVIDAGSSRTRFTRRLWQNASAVLVVATGEAEAIMNAYAAIKSLARVESPPVLRTLVNRCAEAAEAEDIHGRIADASRRFLGLRASGAGRVATAAPFENESQPIFSARTEPARTLDRVADVLWAQVQVRERR